jgi:hypothetical protein
MPSQGGGRQLRLVGNGYSAIQLPFEILLVVDVPLLRCGKRLRSHHASISLHNAHQQTHLPRIQSVFQTTLTFFGLPDRQAWQ